MVLCIHGNTHKAPCLHHRGAVSLGMHDLRACIPLFRHLFPFVDTFNNHVAYFKAFLCLQDYVNKGNRLINEELLDKQYLYGGLGINFTRQIVINNKRLASYRGNLFSAKTLRKFLIKNPFTKYSYYESVTETTRSIFKYLLKRLTSFRKNDIR